MSTFGPKINSHRFSPAKQNNYDVAKSTLALLFDYACHCRLFLSNNSLFCCRALKKSPQVAPSTYPRPPTSPQAASSPPPPPISSGFSVLFCRLYFAATSGVCLIRSLRRRWFFKRNYIRKKSDWKLYVYKIYN